MLGGVGAGGQFSFHGSLRQHDGVLHQRVDGLHRQDGCRDESIVFRTFAHPLQSVQFFSVVRPCQALKHLDRVNDVFFHRVGRLREVREDSPVGALNFD